MTEGVQVQTSVTRARLRRAFEKMMRRWRGATASSVDAIKLAGPGGGP